MDKDRIAGAAKDFAGKAEGAVGNMTGDARTQAEGRAREAAGTVQNLYGQAKDAVSDAADTAVNYAKDAIGNPADGPYVLDELRAHGGDIGSVSDEEILECIGLLAETEGVFAETAGGVTIALATRRVIIGATGIAPDGRCLVRRAPTDIVAFRGIMLVRMPLGTRRPSRRGRRAGHNHRCQPCPQTQTPSRDCHRPLLPHPETRLGINTGNYQSFKLIKPCGPDH